MFLDKFFRARRFDFVLAGEAERARSGEDDNFRRFVIVRRTGDFLGLLLLRIGLRDILRTGLRDTLRTGLREILRTGLLEARRMGLLRGGDLETRRLRTGDGDLRRRC